MAKKIEKLELAILSDVFATVASLILNSLLTARRPVWETEGTRNIPSLFVTDQTPLYLLGERGEISIMFSPFSSKTRN